MTRELPLAPLHAARGARFRPERGWSVPEGYGDPTVEVAALRTGAVLADLSDRGTLVVRGADRGRFLQGQLSNDVLVLRPGGGCRAALLTRKGKLIADLVVAELDEVFVLDTDADRAAPAQAALARFAVADDVEIDEVTGGWARLAVLGPAAASVVGAVLGGTAPSLAPFGHAPIAGGGWQGAAPAAPRVVRRDELPSQASLWVAPDDAERAFTALLAAGARPIGRAALDLAGLEAGEARFGLDVDEETNPLEANWKDRISYTKGCYVGQEVVAKATHVGHPARRIVGLLVEDGAPPAAGAEVELGGEVVGRITRAAVSPTLGRPIALASEKWKHAEPGRAVVVREGEAVRAATLAALPFVGGSGPP